jgi:hypothetical protein
VQQHPDASIFASFPGVRPIGTAVLLAEIGEDRNHYPTRGTLLAEAGLAPVTRSSGRSHPGPVPLRANTRLRAAVTWWSYNSIKESAWAAEAYQQARGRGEHYYRALRGLGARWTRVLWRCWTNRTTYNPVLHVKPSTEELTTARSTLLTYPRGTARAITTRANTAGVDHDLALGTLTGPTMSRTNVCRAGLSTASTTPRASGECEHDPDRDVPGRREPAQQQRRHRGQRLRPQQHRPLVDPVGE